jgi:hypothetical protein
MMTTRQHHFNSSGPHGLNDFIVVGGDNHAIDVRGSERTFGHPTHHWLSGDLD